ncbi:HET-domain-containing protein [Pilatotrama ljubarskyi]|nr:HET-domain-containing protein [Pilatotrama ljubarskyi]
MYLLDTLTGELEFVADPSKERYAILSHVWQRKSEMSFQELERLKDVILRSPSRRVKSRRSGKLVSVLPWVSAKIRNCCEYARQRGFRKVWIDTCCIDKRSSSELSEAINSMYDWYARAEVCFAYLQDVSDKEDPTTPHAAFRRSEWFTRGWTLQELIAPSCVEFLAKEWGFLGSKATLASVVEQVTGIHRDILTHERPLDSVSVAARMSWASKRRTGKLEDEAYSLMGIFGVKMLTNYGEGRAAFVMLQEEILKRSRD